ncbi:Predicted ATPase [Ceraceosorus bombacis]|uniref:Predicted ATPase n=1 Tax=Ceraceosorus bombacis TaxID=401625 RepID=A0A0P1BLL0_9BASI|nr:Predicted ATPase [Ceraceosorus bombacis]
MSSVRTSSRSGLRPALRCAAPEALAASSRLATSASSWTERSAASRRASHSAHHKPLGFIDKRLRSSAAQLHNTSLPLRTTSSASTSQHRKSFASTLTAASGSAASSTSAPDRPGPKRLYDERVEKGLLREDAHQRRIVEGPLQQMYDELQSYTQQVQPEIKKAVAGLLTRWFSQKKDQHDSLPISPDVPKGLYLYGDVGTGKSMLMDMLHATLPPTAQRIHFHAFMVEAHKRMHAFKSSVHKPSGMVMSAAKAITSGEVVSSTNPAGAASAAVKAAAAGEEVDPIPPVARALAKEHDVVCFDEFQVRDGSPQRSFGGACSHGWLHFQVTDIADAMILRRLLEHMVYHGVVFVMTSNRHPNDLYKNGIQRSSFIPCIELLKSQFRVVDLNSGIDYRKQRRALSKVYFHPLNDETKREMDKLWKATTSGDPSDPVMDGRQLSVWGRKLAVPQSTTKAARFDFMDLCGTPKSAADYLEICKSFDTLFIDNIPQMSIHQRDLARRFITFVDACYEAKSKIFMSSEVPIVQVLSSKETDKADIEKFRLLMDDLGMTMESLGGSPIVSGDEELFAWARLISRVTEMGTKAWAESSKGESH